MTALLLFSKSEKPHSSSPNECVLSHHVCLFMCVIVSLT